MKLILAVAAGQIIGALRDDWYKGAEYDYPHGWKHLNGAFDQVDLDCEEEVSFSILRHYKPKSESQDFDKACEEKQDVWLPAHRGTEKEFTTRSGKRLLYCFNPALDQHAYLDVNEDRILGDQEVSIILQ